jgi:photosystem II stability/assembly factor-like uncharacterized protein
VKGPLEIEENGYERALAESVVGGDQDAVSGKTYLRQAEFLEQRGLSRDAQPLSLNGGPQLTAAPEPASPYLTGAQEKSTMLAEAPPAAGVAWRLLGPTGIPDGQTYGSGPGSTALMSGRVTAIAVDPDDSNHVLLGSAAGGVWETRDGGAEWTPRTDDQPTLSIGALAFDPSDGSTVYAGTGEGNSEYFHLGQGILVSQDGGSTWAVMADDVFADVGFYRLVVDPRDGQRLIVATTGGAAVSTDGGGTWSLLHEGVTWDVSLAYRGDEPEILLAAPDGLFAATGGGAPAQVDLPGLGAIDPDRERMAVAHVPSDPGQAFVFAATQAEARLWRRAGADEPFAAIELPSIEIPPYVDNAFGVGQASYDWHLSIPSGSDTVIYVGTTELMKGERDGDDWSWSDISSRLDAGDSIHPDQHTMAFDAQNPDVIYAGNDGGIFRSPDAGTSWESLNDGLGISEVEYLSQRPDEPGWLLAGLQDNGTIRREQDGAWAQVALGDGGDCGTNMSAPHTCFHSYYFMAMERSTHGGDRDTWKNVTPPEAQGKRKLFYPPVEVNGDVVVKAGEVVHVSGDSGSHWAHIQLPQPPAGQRASVASALAISAEDSVLVGTIRGEVFRIDPDGGGWGDPVPLTAPRQGWISDLLVDAGTSGRLWATFSQPGAVFRSDDAGGSWDDVTANLPSIPVNAIIADPADPDRVWVACDVGVFESTNAGSSWTVFGTGLPNALAVDLLFYEPDRLLRVGTRSRGVWEAAVG